MPGYMHTHDEVLEPTFGTSQSVPLFRPSEGACLVQWCCIAVSGDEDAWSWLIAVLSPEIEGKPSAEMTSQIYYPEVASCKRLQGTTLQSRCSDLTGISGLLSLIGDISR